MEHPANFVLAGFEGTIRADVVFSGRPQLFFAVNQQGRGLLVFRTSLRLMIMSDPTRARQEAADLLAPTNVVWDTLNHVDFRRTLLKFIESRLVELVTDDMFSIVHGATGGDNQWFLHNSFELRWVLI